ncbi:MAG: chemotaxis protein CheB, partial [Gracilibacteraceae bacterium]|nr:chemotaxis protein CheB [Gracilibacteraceae bacterium]
HLNVSLPGANTCLVAIGISTGGPKALEKVLTGLPVDLEVPVVVAQHMPAGFTELLAKRLNSICPVEVKEAKDGEILQRGIIYIAKSGMQIELIMREAMFVARIFENNEELYKPSVDILFKSLARTPAASCVLGVIMTGMGSDGLEGVRELKARGGSVIAESETSCIVYGMSRSVIEAGLADQVEDVSNIAEAIQGFIKNQRGRD